MTAPQTLSTRDTAACLVVGSIGILVLGVQPVLLAPLVVEGRIAEATLGSLATTEIRSIAVGSVVGARDLGYRL